MADADREDEERYQDGKWIDPVAEEIENPELPQHGDDRAEDRPHGQLEGAGVELHRDRRDHDGNEEEHQHAAGAVAHIAHDLRR